MAIWRGITSLELTMRKTILALSIAAAMLPPICAWAQQALPSPRQALLSVEGTGRAEAKPDYARLTANVTAKAATLEAAVQASQGLVSRADALLQSLKDETLGVESSNFSLAETHPPYPPVPPQGTPPAPSYTATTTYTLKVGKLDHLNAVIEKLAASGVVEMHAVTFHVQDERGALDEARRKAVADARHQAETLADAAGVRLDEITAISNVRATPRPYVAAAEMASARFAPVQPPSTLDFDATVVMNWHISPKP